MTPKLDVNGVSFPTIRWKEKRWLFLIYHFPCLPVNLQPWSARPAAENPPFFLFSAVVQPDNGADPLRRPSAAPIAV